jgi:hypothetical protein
MLTGTDIVVTAGTGLEVSLDDVSFFPSVNVTYTAPTLAATTIYVRVAASATQGAMNTTVTNVGGGASVSVTITGSVLQNYYSKSSGMLDDLATWGTIPDGSGTQPTDFNDDYQVFHIVNQFSPTIAGAWDVSGTDSKVIVGDGVSTVMLNVPANTSISPTTVIDVTENSTLTLSSNIIPDINVLADNSTVEFAQLGTTPLDTIRIPALSYYHLTFTGGLKYFSSGTTTVRGNFTAVSVTSMNGATGPFSTLNLFGNYSTIGGSSFEPQPTGDNGRITLAMNGTGTQFINGSGDLLIFRLRRDTVTSSVVINVASGIDLTLGNASGGGLQLNQGGATTTVLELTSPSELSLIGGAVATNNSLGQIDASDADIRILKSNGTTTAGTLRFTPGSVVDEFTVNIDPAVTRDSITIATDLTISSSVILTDGKLVMAPGTLLSLPNTALMSGSEFSFVDGAVARTGSIDFTFQIGKGNKYAPVDLLNLSADNTYTIQYFNTGYGDYDIDPATLATYPTYRVSNTEYWTVNQSVAGTTDIVFHYHTGTMGDASQLRIAHYDMTDWNDLGGIPDPANTQTTGSVRVNTVAEFGPFTFSAIAAGALPVTLKNFFAQKTGAAVKLTWTTEQELNASHFVVERSVNGRTWNAIGTVAAAGNSNTIRNYSLMDNAPSRGTNFYRLKIVDLDAKSDYSQTRIVSFSNDANIIISPNPAVDFVNISLVRNSSDPVMIQLSDLSGKVYKTVTTVDSWIPLNVSALPSGVYFIRIKDGENITTHKLIK